MNRNLLKPAAGLLVLLGISGHLSALDAQPLFTEMLCGPGTTWMSLPSESDIMTAEQLCLAIGPAAVSVAQFFPDGTARYTYDCTTGACTTAAAVVPEPGCTASTCFCVNPGEGFEVVTSAPAAVPINGCDSYVPLNVPMGSGTMIGSLVSVPFHTTLVTFGDLARLFSLPALTSTIAGRNCATGVIITCSAGTASCETALLIQGLSYRLRSTTSGTVRATNPVACMPPAPPAAACPVDMLTVTPSGASYDLAWSPPGAGCALPLTYDVARFDLDCPRHYCRHCATCSIIATTALTTFTDTPPPGDFGYLVSVTGGGTWNEVGVPGSMQCTNLDLMFAQGCP